MTASEVRALRALVYGECSDHNWLMCEHLWMKPEASQWPKEAIGRNHLLQL